MQAAARWAGRTEAVLAESSQGPGLPGLLHGACPGQALLAALRAVIAGRAITAITAP